MKKNVSFPQDNRSPAVPDADARRRLHAFQAEPKAEYPTPEKVLFEIGVVLAVTLGIALVVVPFILRAFGIA